MSEPLDALGRPALAAEDRARIREAFDGVTGRGALVVIVDPTSKEARAHLAAKYGEHWKIAGGLGVPWSGRKPRGWVGVELVW